jgi:hypothetical protein
VHIHLWHWTKLNPKPRHLYSGLGLTLKNAMAGGFAPVNDRAWNYFEQDGCGYLERGTSEGYVGHPSDSKLCISETNRRLLQDYAVCNGLTAANLAENDDGDGNGQQPSAPVKQRRPRPTLDEETAVVVSRPKRPRPTL